MSYNQVFKSLFIKNIVKNGKTMAVEFATEISAWKCTQLANTVKEDFTQALEKSDVPANAAKAILVETEHPSDNDNRDHFTTAFQDENNNHITTKHIYRQS
ncbi:hypothetical protein DPV78_006401 [Talaromyces pinophilus]|nr:hypothetical protein DPV78_006401 [Talaromyces pinophilus]